MSAFNFVVHGLRISHHSWPALQTPWLESVSAPRARESRVCPRLGPCPRVPRFGAPLWTWGLQTARSYQRVGVRLRRAHRWKALFKARPVVCLDAQATQECVWEGRARGCSGSGGVGARTLVRATVRLCPKTKRSTHAIARHLPVGMWYFLARNNMLAHCALHALRGYPIVAHLKTQNMQDLINAWELGCAKHTVGKLSSRRVQWCAWMPRQPRNAPGRTGRGDVGVVVLSRARV
jgi:hypothetical protein